MDIRRKKIGVVGGGGGGFLKLHSPCMGIPSGQEYKDYQRKLNTLMLRFETVDRWFDGWAGFACTELSVITSPVRSPSPSVRSYFHLLLLPPNMIHRPPSFLLHSRVTLPPLFQHKQQSSSMV